MAISDFQVGAGQYPLAYGEHVVSGILADVDNSNPSAVKIKILLGLGEWNRLKEVSYDGTVISDANYTFHPGTSSTGAADPLQGADARFPNSIYHNQIAYYTMTIPDGMGAEDRPDKMRVIAEALKMYSYDSSGVPLSYIYSVNPADVFADLVRRNSLELGLDFTSRMDWPAYAAARAIYANTILIDTRKYTPEDVAVSNVASGSLASGTWYYKVVSVGASGAMSTAADIVAVDSTASSKNELSWTAMEDGGATGYRVYYSYNDPNAFTHYFAVTDPTTPEFTHTTTSGASSGSPPNLPTGSWAEAAAEFQTHRAFTQANILTGDALTAVMFDAASEWVMDGEKYRIIPPNPTAISHTFTTNNTTDENLSYSKVPLRERVNRVSASFRNLDKKLAPDEQTPANDFVGQSRIGVVEEVLQLGSMNTSQMRRITNWRMKSAYGKPRKFTVTGLDDSSHLLVGDLVGVQDRQAGTRSDHGTVANGGILTSSKTAISSILTTGSSSIKYDGSKPTPGGKSQPLTITLSGGGTRVYGNALLTVIPTSLFTTAESSVLTYIYIKPDSVISEITLAFLDAGLGGAAVVGAMRNPQTTALSVTLGGTETRFRDLPPNGGWIPIRIKLTDIGFAVGGHLTAIAYHANGISGEVSFSETVYFESPSRTYVIDSVTDSASDAAGQRQFDLLEFYPSAYNPHDAYVEPPPSGGGTAYLPTFNSVSQTSGVVSGSFTNNGGTGTIHILRKLGGGGTYAEVTSASSDATTFSDSPGEDGTYYYKLTQDGVAGETSELSVVVTIGSGGTAPSSLTGYTTFLSETRWRVNLSWTNNGATGDNIVEVSSDGSDFSEFAAVSSGTSSLSRLVSPDTGLYYRVRNTGASGYSNDLYLETF